MMAVKEAPYPIGDTNNIRIIGCFLSFLQVAKLRSRDFVPRQRASHSRSNSHW